MIEFDSRSEVMRGARSEEVGIWDEGGNTNLPCGVGSNWSPVKSKSAETPSAVGSALLTLSIRVGEGTASGLKEGGIVTVVFGMPGEAASKLAIDEPSEGSEMPCTGLAAAPSGKWSFSRGAG